MEPPAQPFEHTGDPAPAEQDAWTGPSQQEWNDYLSFRDQVQTAQQQYEQELAQQQTQQGASIDWLDEDSQAQLDRYLDQRLQQRLEPIQEFQEQVARAEGDQRAQDILNDIVARDGDFIFNDPDSQFGDSKKKARELANNYFPEVAQRHGYGTSMWNPTRAAEAAMEQAVKDVRAWEQAVGKAYYEREVNQLRGLAGAPREPGAAGTGAAQQHLVGGLGNVPGAVTSKFFAGQG